jgi:lysophospholipase L1-like esterase
VVVAVVLSALLACGDDASTAVVFDGQSLNRVPVPDFPALAMAGLGKDADAVNVAVIGASWTQLARDVDKRRDPFAKDRYAVLVMVGGTSDVAVERDDGPTIYRDMAAYAESARAAGYDYIIAATLQPFTGATREEDAARKEANRLLLEEGDAFDEVVDLAGIAGLDDPKGSDYVDGIGHPSEAGAKAMADAMRPAIEDALHGADALFP